MRKRKLRYLRNIGIAAHIDAGKTTMTERVLYYTGKNHKIGDTHTGNTVMDHTKEERDRGITITSAATQTQWQWNNQEHVINIIDTPGHIDFTIEVERSLRVLEGMVALFCAVGGVEPQSETVWRQANNYGVPRIGFVNKMDLAGANFFAVIQQVNERLGSRAIAVQVPIGEEENFEGIVDLITLQAYIWDGSKGGEMQAVEIPSALMEEVLQRRTELVETLAEFDEVLFDKFFENDASIEVEDLQRALRKAVHSLQLVPMFCGSAYRNKGVEPLLDAICCYLPSPVDVPAVEGAHPEREELEVRQASEDEPFAGLVFKIATDEQNRRYVFLRVYSGSAERGATVWNARAGKKERLANMYQLHGGKRMGIDAVYAGDIVAIVGMKDVRTGDTICAIDAPIVLEQINFPEPVIGMAIETKSNKDHNKLGMALSKLMEEDPSFHVAVNAETGQTIMRGMGELHLEVILHRLRDDFGINCNVGAPEVTYKEALSTTVEHKYRLKKQNGGVGLFAEIEFEIGPADEEFLQSEAFLSGKTRLQFVNAIRQGAISKDLIPSVQKGFASMLDKGILADYSFESLKVRLFDGGMHSKDSGPLAFELCAQEAFNEIAPMAKPILLEPMMDVEVLCPESEIGTVISSINRRRGLPKGLESRPAGTIVKATVPLAELFGYVSAIRAATAGRASATLTFSHYQQVPDDVKRDIMAKRRGTLES